MVEREPYFRLCLSEVCACDTKRACHCNVLTAFARHCAQEGALVRWRNQTLCREFGDFFHAVLLNCGRLQELYVYINIDIYIFSSFVLYILYANHKIKIGASIVK